MTVTLIALALSAGTVIAKPDPCVVPADHTVIEDAEDLLATVATDERLHLPGIIVLDEPIPGVEGPFLRLFIDVEADFSRLGEPPDDCAMQ